MREQSRRRRPTRALHPSTSLAACVATTLAALLLLASASPAAAQDAAGEPGAHFTRADLVDVATWVADRSGTGFVLADASLRGLSLSLYVPAPASAEQVRAMFLLALDANGIEAVQQQGFWLIRRKAAGSGAAEVSIDFRRADLEEVVAFLSQVGDRRFIVTSDVPRRPLTIQAQRPVSSEAALELVLSALEAEGIAIEHARDGSTIILRGSSSATSSASLATSPAPTLTSGLQP